MIFGRKVMGIRNFIPVLALVGLLVSGLQSARAQGGSPDTGVRLELIQDLQVDLERRAGVNQDSKIRSGWEIVVTPDLWAAGLEGTVSVGGVESDIDVGVEDLLENLDYGGALHIEAKKNKWTILADFLYLKLSGAETASISLGPLINRPIGPIVLTGPGVTLDVDVEAQITTFLGELGLAYEVWNRPIGEEGSRKRFVAEILGGARYWYFRTELEVDIEATLGPVSRSRSISIDETIDWIDPFIGGRLQFDLTEKLFVRLRGDIGGFGVGSDFTWKAAVLAHHQTTPKLSLYVGYQALGVDYTQGSGTSEFNLDVIMHGVVLGFAYRFGSRTPTGEISEVVLANATNREPV